MLRSEKNFILSQVASVLSELQCLVSKLNSVQCEDEEESMSDVANISWDSSQDFPVYSMSNAFYTLAFPESSDEEDFKISQVNCQRKSVNKECSFVNKIKAFITSSFPNAVYNKERSDQIRQDILNENICPEFQSMWRHSNVGDLFIQKPEDSIPINTTANPAPEIKYRTVDFSKLNVRNIKNIPRPELYPIHGCSEDPEFYVKTYWAGGFEYEKKGVTYYKSSPHGSVYGYRTNVGIVPVPTTPVYGYVWSDHDGANLSADWVLHAIFPEERSESRATRPTPRWTTPRRPPSSRRWPT